LAALHLTKDALALHLLLEDLERLIDIVVANEYLQMLSNRAVAVMNAAAEMRSQGCRAEPRRGWTGEMVVTRPSSTVLLDLGFRQLDDLVHSRGEVVHRHLQDRITFLDRDSRLLGGRIGRI